MTGRSTSAPTRPGTGRELWRFDGAGAGLFADLRPGAGSGDPEGFSTFDGALYFVADDGTHGAEPWRVAPAAVPDVPPGPPARPPAVGPQPRQSPSIVRFRTPQRLDQRRVARLARLSCPAGEVCHVAVRERVTVRIGKRRHRVSVLAPKVVRGGRHAMVRVRFSKSAARHLRGHATTLQLKITLADQDANTARKVKVRITGRAERLSRRRTAKVERLSCPAGEVCHVAVRRRAQVRIGARRHSLRVLAPQTIEGGKRATVRVRFSKAAARRLRGRTTTLELKIVLTIDQNDDTTRRVHVRITGKGVRKART